MTVEEVIPPVGIYRTEKHAYYLNGNGPYPGVTTIQGVLDKSGPLMGWAKREVAACAVRNYADLGVRIQSEGPEAAERWLKGIPDRQREKKADLGTRVHALAEEVGKTGAWDSSDEEAWPYVLQYMRWAEDWQPEYLAVEYQGIYPCGDLTYGGTGDLIVESHGERWALDIKTGGYYASTALQLEACSRLYLPDEDGLDGLAPAPHVDRLGVLDLKPDGWKVVEYRYDRAKKFESFLRLVALYRDEVIGNDVRMEDHAA